ncbi:hypothetical protein G3N95_24130 [Paraburkholderia sp. Tr-20389]|uniref:hypothetical protein n=1 Tax=Paraburkholderia sp. Tr-20389 TaxID=2703903 RepID=UPI00197D9ACE|nr:hypothetical protein [Paraburkholderia sp. Tr-20389]MBN3756052.1 hypothetical protein [Paraburkholderia sp. Tr-20389]
MDAIDRLLLDWHEWNLGWELVPGYPRDAGLGGFQSSRQWMDLDDLNDEVDRRIIEGHARVIDPLVLALDERLRVAVNIAMLNLAAGVEVCRNPRWPATQDADYQRAKEVLEPQLIQRGLLDPGIYDIQHPVR